MHTLGRGLQERGEALHQEADSCSSRLDDAVDVDADVEGLQLLKDLQEADDEVLHQHCSKVLRGCLVPSSCRSAGWSCAWISECAGPLF